MARIDVSALRSEFKGNLLESGADYDAARLLFNAQIDRKPALIAQPVDEADVAAAVRFAVQNGIELGIKAGGHGVLGYALADGGITIDLANMRGVKVDPDKRIARVQGGARWGDFDAATQAHALGATGGRLSTTGVAGLTLGGGSGWIERKYGLACDNLRAIEMITAEGKQIRADERENPELLWAHRGGGGNFGVVTTLEFELRPLGPEVYIALLLYPTDEAEAIARNYRQFIETAPEEVGGGIAFLAAPPAEFVPADLQGKVLPGVVASWCGPVDQGEKALAPLTEFGSPLVKMVTPIPYTAFQSMIDEPPNYRNYWSAEYTHELPDEGIDTWAKYGRMQKPSPAQLIWLPWGGAVKRGPDSAVGARDANWVFHPLGLWESPAEDKFWIDWVRSSRKEVAKYSIGTAYMNFQADVTQADVPDAFGKKIYERLAAVKRDWDPNNTFHLNNNIKPA